MAIMLQRIAIYINDSSLPPDVLSSLPPDVLKGKMPILDELVPTSESLSELKIRLNTKFPALGGLIHSFRFSGDESRRYDIPRNNSVKAAVAVLPKLLKTQNTTKARIPVKPDDPLNLRVVAILQRLKEIEKHVLEVETAYWSHFGDIKYLESHPPRPSPSQPDTRENRYSDDTASDVFENTDSDGSDYMEELADLRHARRQQFIRLRNMMVHWRAYSPAEEVTTFSELLPPTTEKGDTSAQTVQIWLKYMRSIKAELNRVPKDLSEKFLPFLRRQLQDPPNGYTPLWEYAPFQTMSSTGTMTLLGDLKGQERQAEYLRMKTAQLAEITERDIEEVSATEDLRAGARVSASFLHMHNSLVEKSFRTMYPGRTDKIIRRSIATVWDMLTLEEKRCWWRRDAWDTKQEKRSDTAKQDERDDESIPPPESTCVGRASAIRIPPNDPSFIVTSGTIYWGHLSTIAYAGVMPSSSSDEPNRSYPFRYRAHARNGTWKLSQISANHLSEDLFGESEEDMKRIGWIVYHDGVDPGETVLR
ncbi:hypothetical protein HDU93_008788, partial [Gonapodya sp. JEL0774]